MGMSTHVTGFAPPDRQWRAMKAVWDACTAANVVIPHEVEDFFGGGEPDERGVEIELPLREWRADMRQGYELDLSDIPEQVRTIRFYNEW